MRRKLASMIAAMCIAMPMMAAQANAQKWTGCYLGGSVGMSATKTIADLNVAPPVFPVATNALSIDGLGSSGTVAGVHVGCDLKLQQLVVGAFGDYAWHNETFEITSALLPGTVATLDVNSRWTVGGRVGIAFTDSTLLYGLVGWSRMSTSDLSIPAGPLTISMPTFQGWVFGGGIETILMPNIRLGLEYRYNRYDTQDIVLIPGATLGLQPEMHTVSARLSYAFTLPELK